MALRVLNHKLESQSIQTSLSEHSALPLPPPLATHPITGSRISPTQRATPGVSHTQTPRGPRRDLAQRPPQATAAVKQANSAVTQNPQ